MRARGEGSSHVLIVAGDASADRHGAALAQALKARHSGLRVSALGGSHLRAAADRFVYPLVGVGGFGFWEPFFKLPQLRAAWKSVSALMREDRPDAVIPMDYYGFNIYVARRAKAHGLSVVYYISPQVWASRPGRVRALKEAVDKMLVIFPFEAPFYERAGVPVRYVGHPLLERLPEPAPPGLGSPVIGLLPGSRRGVVGRHLPIVVEAARLLRERHRNAEFVLFRPDELEPALYASLRVQAPWIRLVCDGSYAERRRLTLALSVSGTSALENMLLGIPMIILYRLSPLTYWIAKRLARVPFVGIPNILAGRAVVPEKLQADCTPERLAEAASAFLDDPDLAGRTRDALLELRRTLSAGGTPRAAEEILATLDARPGESRV